MLSESQRGMAKISAEAVLDLKYWQKIQDLFAEIISANLWLINLQGIPLTNPSKICTCCSELNSSNYSSAQLPECVFKAYQLLIQKNEVLYQCSHSLTYFLIPMKHGDQTFAFVIGGPIILGKKESDKYYKAICQKLGIESENFMDWIRELKVFSLHRINLAINFLREISHFQWPEPRKDFLASSLLEIASQIVGADSGSVLLVDPAKNSFSIQSAHGLDDQIVKKKTVPLKEGVAGWVVEHQKSVLITPQRKSAIPQSILKRPHIKSSMIVPLEFQGQVYGVFCVNSKTDNSRFNEKNLMFLNHLGKIASAALSQSSLN